MDYTRDETIANKIVMDEEVTNAPYRLIMDISLDDIDTLL